MATNECPYRSLPDTAYWKRRVTEVGYGEVDPVVSSRFRISRRHKIATAGSCFAQEIARYLAQSGFAYFVAEPAPAILPARVAREFNYGVFSCRYGNIYTTRQLCQTFDRAFGKFQSSEPPWRHDGWFIDPFRPFIQPKGFLSRGELVTDREQHLAAVRRMFEECDVFVYTLGLTEGWIAKADGTALPVCPGCGVGVFNRARYEFHNETYEEVVQNFNYFVDAFRQVNSAAKIIITVSPVPLIATMESRHVLVSTVYSKSVLRTAADTLERTHPHVTYFPSYEIATGAFNRGRYFAEDLRTVTREGVDHIMRLFMKHFTVDTTEGSGVVGTHKQEQVVVDTSVAASNDVEKAGACSAEVERAMVSLGADESDLICDEMFMIRRIGL